MNKNNKIYTFILLCFLLPTIVLAHSGKTSSEGCHTNRKTGDYHCHNQPIEEVKATRTEARTEARNTSKKYICSYNAYNCSDFSTNSEAREAYEFCGGISNDVHDLDRDKDGLACESN